MSTRRLTHAAAHSALALVVLAALAVGCGGGDAHPPGASGGPHVAPYAPDDGSDCSAPSYGCPCNAPGTSTVCKAFRKSGDYIACSDGTRACGDDRKWQRCIGDSEWVPYVPPADAGSEAATGG